MELEFDILAHLVSCLVKCVLLGGDRVQVNISTRHGNLGSEAQEKIKNRTEKLSRFKERISSIDVTIDLEHSEQPDVEIRVSVERANDFVSRANGGNVMKAVDGCLHKLEQQLRRHKAKLVEHRGTGRRTEVPSDTEPTDERISTGDD